MQIANPFLRSMPNKAPRPRNPQLNVVARELVFGSGDLTSDEVSQVFTRTRLKADADLSDQELDNAQEAFLGIAAHEAAEQAFEAFNAELTKYQDPENLTRVEVKKIFEQSRYGKMLQKHEQVAIGHFSNLLEKDGDFSAATSENTGFDAIDIKTYLIDLQNRVTERLEDPEERKAKLEELDAELAALIKAVPEDSWGKKLELQEIYLLRRLIHRADTGHLAHVSHGTLRQDLRADMGSVDMRLAVAGDLFDFQLKTFKSGVSDEARARQYDVIKRSKHRAEDSGTHFVMLETDRVQVAYDRSQRQKTSEKQTVGDKFAALQPLTNDLTIRERARTLQLFGLNEETLAKEQAEFDEQQLRMNEHLRDVRAKAAADEKKRTRELDRIKQEEAEEKARQLASIEAQLAHQESQREESAAKRKQLQEMKDAAASAKLAKANDEARLQREAEKNSIIQENNQVKKAMAALAEEHCAPLRFKLLTRGELIKDGFLASIDKYEDEPFEEAKKSALAIYTNDYLIEHRPELAKIKKQLAKMKKSLKKEQ